MNQQVLDQQLLSQLQSAQPHLPKALAKLTDFILADPQTVLFSSTAELSTAAQVGEATLIRFCRKFGYAGYQEFKLALAASLSNSHPSVPIEPTSLESRNQQLLNETIQLAKQTLGGNTSQTIDTVVDLVKQSRNVIVFGVGTSSSTAREYAFRFLRAGIFAVAFEDVHEATLSLNVQKEKLVLLILSISGQTSDAIRLLTVGNSLKLPTIVITTSAQSPIAMQAQHLLLTPLPSQAEAPLGKIGQLLLLEVFARELSST